MTTTATATAAPEAPALAPAPAGVELTLTDYCDGEAPGHVQAYVLAAHPGYGELLFCKHHFEAHEYALGLDDWIVVADTRHTLA